MRNFFLYLIIFFIPFLADAQSRLSTKSKKAEEYYFQADNYRVRGQYAQAMDLLDKALKKDDEFAEAYFLKGLIYKTEGMTDNAKDAFQKSYQINNSNLGVLFELGGIYLSTGDYAKAKQYSEEYLSHGPKNQRYINVVKKRLHDADFAVSHMNDVDNFSPHPISNHVNAFPMQYFPVLSVDQKSIIYTRRLGISMEYDEDLVISSKAANGEWGLPQSLSKNINSEYNEGTCTLSADGRTLIFTSCYGRKGYGSCDLYITHKVGDNWSEPKNLGSKINTRAWESQPSLSADGRTLYFVSNRHTGDMGNRDIWVSYLDDNEQWTTPENVGDKINTMGDEVSPFIHPNGITLYFASDGHTGFGGFDIYSVEKDVSTDEWKQVENIGYPINNSEDQVSLFITADGEKGYYSHELNNTVNQRSVIYEFDVPEELRIEAVTSYVKGKVYDANTQDPIKANIQLFDLSNDRSVAKVTSDSISGAYLMVLPKGSDYALYTNKRGYLFESMSFNYKNEAKDPVEIDIYLKPIEKGSRVVLNNIFFALDSYSLESKSKTELDRLISFLKENPKSSIEIGGHTDNQGSAQYNLSLSNKRAKEVYEYLINNSISPKQLSYKGYGQDAPAYPNDTEEHREKNRRIEFKIVE